MLNVLLYLFLVKIPSPIVLNKSQGKIFEHGVDLRKHYFHIYADILRSGIDDNHYILHH